MNSTSSNQPGKFITIEGVEGVGKSTNIGFIRDYLNERGIEFIQTREPGGTELAESIRALLLQERRETVDSTTELLLVFAARSQHLSNVIRPALERGCWVLCDRFTDATYAYQGGGREIGSEKISILEHMVQDQLRPDLTLILDLDPELGLKRAADRGELDRFEKERVEFFHRVRDTYLQIAEKEPERCKIVDASHPIETVRATTLEFVASLCKEVSS
ncbi:MAG: dTMP kinase [Gammaproteobacteria bacterium]|nr:dTMP kinase [Gammaproteobacteria bacterium]